MPRIPKHRRRVTPSGRVGGVPIPSDIADVGGRARARGLAALGRGIGNLGQYLYKTAEEAAEIRSEEQYLQGASIWEKRHTEFLTELSSDQNFQNYGKKYNDFATALRDELLADDRDLTKNAKRFLSNYITQRQPAVEKHIAGRYLKKQKDFFRASTVVSIDTFEKALDADGAISTIDSAQRMGIMSAEEAATRKLKVASNVDWYVGLQLIDADAAEFERLMDADADGKIDYTFLPALSYAQKVQLRSTAAVRVAQQRTVQERERRVLAEETRKSVVDDYINDKLTPATLRQRKESMDADDYERWNLRLLRDVENERNTQKKLLELKDPANREIYLKIQNGEITKPEQINKYVELEQISVEDAKKRQAELKSKLSIRVETAQAQAELNTMALDIWRGAVTKKDFNAALDDALANEIINTSEYVSLAQTAAQTLKSSQAEALRRADTDAGRILVDHREAVDWEAILFATPIEKQDDLTAKRKLQFWYLSRYNQELRNWLAEKPDKTGKDFYEYAEQLKHQYWNTSIDEIRSLKLEREAEFKRKPPSEPEIEITYDAYIGPPEGIETIWDELNFDEKTTALMALSQGITAERIVEHFEGQR